MVSIPINKDIQQRIEEGETGREDKVGKRKISFSDFNIEMFDWQQVIGDY